MKLVIRFISALTLLLFCSSNISAQFLQSVDYQMKYNVDSCWYDCYFIINSGSTGPISLSRAQGNAQYSFVVPTGTAVSIPKTYAPYKNNLAGGNTSESIDWTISTTVTAPVVTPDVDYISVTPELAQNGFYEPLTAGDTVKIFSLQVDTVFDCSQGIRIWHNDNDPNPLEDETDGMGGADFDNGFTVGQPTNLYNANATQLYPPNPVFIDAATTCSAGIEIDLTAETTVCQGALSYAWDGPASYSSTNEDVNLPTATNASNGIYSVTVTDEFGCKDSLEILATGKPDAGADFTACAGSIDTLRGTDPTNGVWEFDSAVSPVFGMDALDPLGGGEAQVTFSNFASGDYTFYYGLPTGCQDTVVVSINPKPILTINGPSQICIGDMTDYNANVAGTWSSSDDSKATIDASTGAIVGVSSGNVTFTFVDGNGCSSTTADVTVSAVPTASVPQPELCLDATLQATPSAGGNWTSVDGAIASITSSGLITANAVGTAQFIFQEDGTNCYADTVELDIIAKPIISFSDSDSLCINDQTQMLVDGATGVLGSWSSSNDLIATINNNGVVTTLSDGIVFFTFTPASATNCPSDPSGNMTVFPDPVVSISGETSICIGKTTQAIVTPDVPGMWTSSNAGALTIDETTGLITAVGSGFATFTFTNGETGCTAVTEVVIVDGSPTVFAGDTDICIGTSTELFPESDQGTWEALNSGIAELDVDGFTVTGVSGGTAGFIFTENGTDCKSDTLFIIVDEGPTANLNDTEICVNGTTQLTTDGATGFWQSSNEDIATVTPTGFVIGVSAGDVTFTFIELPSLCQSVPTGTLTVRPAPVTQYFTDNSACIGETDQILPASGGTWTSDDESVATITDAGVITAVGPGTTFFIYTDTNTDCISADSDPYTVYAKPTVSYTGDPTLCEGDVAQLSPTAGGEWLSSDEGVAIISSTGLVTAVSDGTVSFTFSVTGVNCPSDPITLTITETPTTPVIDDNELCVDDIANATTDQTGGSWESSNNDVITIDTNGEITAVGQGSATVRYISANNCPSDVSVAIIVNGSDAVTLGTPEMCIGDMSQLTPETGGTWMSSDETIASVDANTGVVTAVSAGQVQFIFTDTNTGCASGSTDFMDVNPAPSIFWNGPTEICVGEQSQIQPSLGGQWASSDETIATITNDGSIVGVAPGKVVFTFFDTDTQCFSAPSDSLTVTPGTIVSSNDYELCIGEFAQLSPSIGGTWVIEPGSESVATVTATGNVVAIGPGAANFIFTSDAGCTSTLDTPIQVNNGANIVLGDSELCIGGTTQMTPSSGGSWLSSDEAVATIDENTGAVLAIGEGVVTFTFTSDATGCTSLPSDVLTVAAATIVNVDGATDICIGSQTTLTSFGVVGEWTSSDEGIAIVDNNGVVTAIGAGQVTFSFTNSSGCEGGSITPVVTISACADPDFDVTYVNVPVPGDVSTNDDVPVGTTYGPTPVLVSSPGGSVESISISGNGEYVFEANTVGVYIYDVPVCVPPLTSGCATATLTITVLDYLEPDNRPVANLDIATTALNTAVTLTTMENDHCVVTTGCSLDPASVSIIANPSNGSASDDNGTGDITYTPNAGFVGYDTLQYQVCVTAEPANCATAYQIILVNSSSTANTTQAADDFAVTQQGEPVSGNVWNNDSDAEGDFQTVTADAGSTVGGSYTLAANGDFTFTPNNTFFGPVAIPYTTTDDNVNPATAEATLHILVVKDLTLHVRAYLSGALLNNGGETALDGRPLMRDDLRQSPFNGNRYIPNTDPFQDNPSSWFFPLVYTHIAPGDRSDLSTIDSPTSVFAVTGQDAIVDWVLVELRNKADNTEVLATRAALVQRDGDVVDLDGFSGVRVPGLKIDDYYVVVNHRHHLGAMTLLPQTARQMADLVDFTDIGNDFWDYGTNFDVTIDFAGLSQNKLAAPGFNALWAGDLNASGKVTYSNGDEADEQIIQFDVIGYPTNPEFISNFDFAYGYLNGDFDMNSKSKYDNPDDDRNYLFLSVLLYPLNEGQYLSNFDLFIEQVPVRSN